MDWMSRHCWSSQSRKTGVRWGLAVTFWLVCPGWVHASPVLSFDLPGKGEALEAQPVPPPLLSFAPPEVSPVFPATVEPGLLSPGFQALFEGGSDSLVARVVGSAEGTRTRDGAFTWAYYGHRDPGNGKWNLGSFSYQHEASSPVDADQRQLRRLEAQTQVLHQLATQQGLELSLDELLNGIDLANQAPLAALDRGYIDWLKEARQLALGEAEGILFARTWSYWDPDLDSWNAPGLGNRWLSISEDQKRRQEAIEGVLERGEGEVTISSE